VKRLIVAMLIVSLGLIVLGQVFAAEFNDRRAVETRSRYASRSRTRAVADVNSVTEELDFLADPNEVKTKVKEYEGLEKALEKVTKGSLREMREWGRGPVEERIELAELVQEQAVDELVLIHQIAVEEGALKTAAAVEALLLDRQQRFEKIFGRLERSMRRAERFERSRMRGRRDMRYRYREPDGNQQMYDEEMYRNGQRDRYRDRGYPRDRG